MRVRPTHVSSSFYISYRCKNPSYTEFYLQKSIPSYTMKFLFFVYLCTIIYKIFHSVLQTVFILFLPFNILKFFLITEDRVYAHRYLKKFFLWWDILRAHIFFLTFQLIFFLSFSFLPFKWIILDTYQALLIMLENWSYKTRYLALFSSTYEIHF